MWKSGWPQPGAGEKGKGGAELNGGHGDLGNSEAQECPDTAVKVWERKRAANRRAECGGGGGMGDLDPEAEGA